MKRYNMQGLYMDEHAEGEYIEYADHQDSVQRYAEKAMELQAEVEHLRALLHECGKVVGYLRKPDAKKPSTETGP